MDVITVDGKQYDPYFILDVTKDDSDKHISKSFRSKVKKYHPDKYVDKEKKIKYEQYFKILSESYRYIKDKRSEGGDLKTKYKNHQKQKSCTETTSIEIKNKVKKTRNKKTRKDFDELNSSCNKNLEELDPNKFGYGEDYKRIEKVEDYENENITICKQFGKKKFSLKEFNRMFEYNRRNEDNDKITSKALIHKTTDGFAGYNSSDFGNSALVSSFNGLLITGDDLGERGVGYWGANYSDYKYSYKRGTKNPDRRIKVPEHFIPETSNKKYDENVDKKYSEYKCNYHKGTTAFKNTSNFKNEQDILYKNTYNNLLEKERSDKNMVMKYINQYDNHTIKMALEGELDKTPTYISTLQKYIRD